MPRVVGVGMTRLKELIRRSSSEMNERMEGGGNGSERNAADLDVLVGD